MKGLEPGKGESAYVSLLPPVAHKEKEAFQTFREEAGEAGRASRQSGCSDPKRPRRASGSQRKVIFLT